MYLIVTILIFIVAILLVLVVLVQNSKGGGLAANFSSTNQIMGVRKTADFLEKSTWTLAAVRIFLCVVAGLMVPRASEVNAAGPQSQIQRQIDEAVDPTSVPGFSTTLPAATEAAAEAASSAAAEEAPAEPAN